MSSRGKPRPRRSARPPKRLAQEADNTPAQQKRPKLRKSKSKTAGTDSEGECGLQEVAWWSNHSDIGGSESEDSVTQPSGLSQAEAKQNLPLSQEGVIAALYQRIEALEKRENERKSKHKGQELDDLLITVSSDLRDKILGGKFVDLSLLLAKSFQEKPEEKSVILVQDKKGRLVSKDERQSQPVLSISQWTSAFHVYMSVYLEGHPEALQGMLAYAELIRGAARDHEGRGWAKYDQRFRSHREADPTRPWGMIDSQLWLTLFTKPAHQSAGAGTTQQTRSDDQRKPNLDNACYFYNKPKGCMRPSCPYKHSCARCSSSDHPISACWRESRDSRHGASNTSPKLLVTQGQRNQAQIKSQSNQFLQSFRFGTNRK